MCQKLCGSCERSLPLERFSKDLRSKGRGLDGLQSKCKDCEKAYRDNHREHRTKYFREYHRKNRDTLLPKKHELWNKKRDVYLVSKRKYRDANKRAINERKRQFALEHPETVARWKRDSYLRNKDKIKRRIADYVRAHPERRRVISLNYKARKRNAEGSFTSGQLSEKCEYWGWRCYLCGKALTPTTAHAEHRKPLSRGGSNFIANVAPACQRCNNSKKDKTEAEFRERREISRYAPVRSTGRFFI